MEATPMQIHNAKKIWFISAKIFHDNQSVI